MQLAMIGLGRMGGNMVERLMRGGHSLVVFDRSIDAIAKYETMGAKGAKDLAGVATALSSPRIVWIMVPSGQPVDDTIAALVPNLGKGDVIIDGGNSNFKDSMRRAESLSAKGIAFIDSGTSGGIWGLANGYCLMVGGTKEAVGLCEPIFRTLAPENGFAHVGPAGAGHYVKMVHNG
ncbi:MAG: NAD(P)-binding domain-containing protein, partial [Gemmatimonadota bacterium]|nr:NAD(P)-binding domain-containing protein [Gemmatimonadota bacterium]